MRTIRKWGAVVGLGLGLVSGVASAGPTKTRGRPLAEAPVPGVTLRADGSIQIDVDRYEVQRRGGKLELTKKKKKDKGPDHAGLACACSWQGAGCSVAVQGNTATCSGQSCCGWIVIVGPAAE